MRNIWHDIDPRCVTPERFTAVIEIPAGSKKKYELDKHTGLLRLDRILYPLRTIRQTTALSRARMRTMVTRWTYWCCAQKRSTRWLRWTAIRSASSA